MAWSTSANGYAGQRVLARPGREQHPVAGRQPAAMTSAAGIAIYWLAGRQGGHAMRVAADEHHAGLRCEGQPVAAAPAQGGGDGAVGDAAGRIDPADPIDHVTQDRRAPGRSRRRQRRANPARPGMPRAQLGEISPVWVSEERVEPFAYAGALSADFLVGGRA